MSEDLDFISFIHHIKSETAIDLSQYKEAQMKRRLTTLRLKHGYNTFAEYWKAIQLDKALMDELLDRMTINVSEFWRNPGRWETLYRRFLPELHKQSPQLRIWSAACSTGEEPYTIAMLLSELGLLDQTDLAASDLDAGVLAKAKEGLYYDRSIRDVPELYKNRYFERTADGMYAVSDKLKKAVRFKQQNLLHDPFESGYDLIVCRNVLIYFTEEAKQTLYRKFSDSLKPGGLLFVGSTEQIFSPAQYCFETADTFFYRKLQS
ncbi:CheR family methyltransferase [Paenibacillus protaetiae]|uniref:protein-glutamate O-methyltransferase n=1 Tax=Paenibacillus protaetiae TaxID=2509456 RepID=A0A4P6ESP7_9BACL|nr:protein-glutamate O-methyltransferase CheR [Paenibacillus protaetiae]QAY66160.1 protein-glutamate O-methyltransferase CheR [Paenibacillus protaetiae]